MKKTRLLSLAMALSSFFLLAVNSEPTMAQPRARFEVTLFRFIVNHETRDDVLERDGARDEVSFSRFAVLHNRRTGSRVLADGFDFSQTFGQSPPNSSRAGHATPSGGLKSGDDVLLPPIVLFSEELIQGESAATIIVSAWEMDGPRGLWSAYKDFLFNYQPDMERVALQTLTNSPQTAPLVRDWDNSFQGGSGPTASVVVLNDGPLGLGEVKDRPIGMIRQGNTYNFIPKLIILNFDNASRAAATNMGSGLGVIKLSYTDDQRLAGDYTLFVKVRRL